jgi:hypothetical protein
MKKAIFTALGILLIQILYSQGVGVSESGADPHPSAILDASSTSKGVVIPRMTTVQRDAIESPVLGLQIFNVTTNCFEAFYGISWQSMHCGCSAAPSDLMFSDNGPLNYCLNQAIAINAPATQGGDPNSFAVSPVLPAGLFLNARTGLLSGTPSELAEAASYTFTASNACGAASREMSIGVITVPGTPAAISGPDAPTVNSSVNYSVSPVSGATSYTWTVPAGWTINSGQGTATINVGTGVNAGNVSVSAANACGVSSASSKAVTSWRPVAATGGAITDYTADGNNGVNGVQYRVHRFATAGSSSFIVSDAGTDGEAEYLLVGGGGGGGGRGGGGGGGGGVRQGTVDLLAQLYTIEVGNGGSGGGTDGASLGLRGGNGQNTAAFSVIALGGGGGGGGVSAAQFNGQAGGCGGGGGGPQSQGAGLGGSGEVSQGEQGGNGYHLPGVHTSGGGGGGASQSGASVPTGNTTVAGNGGQGITSSIEGLTASYAGGGGGGTTALAGREGGNGASGGGKGAGTSLVTAEAGVSGTGGGGGGGRDAPIGPGGAGGSGIVIIRYPLTSPNL